MLTLFQTSKQSKGLRCIKITIALILVIEIHWMLYFLLTKTKFEAFKFTKLFYSNTNFVILDTKEKTSSDRSRPTAISYASTNKQIQLDSACKIPETPMMPLYYKSLWNNSAQAAIARHSCSYERLLATLKEDEQELNLDPKLAGEKCCLQEVLRGNTDSKFSFTDCKVIDGTTHRFDKEENYVLRCFSNLSINLGARFPLKPSVEKKLNFWKSVSEEERPVSVLLIGFDTTSRNHFQRSLPRSLKIMKKMDFVDFKSYHSVQPQTLPNLMAFLMGLTINKVRTSCAPHFRYPYDPCPWVWQEFNEQKYVTMFMEDSYQSMNWDLKKSGFTKQPTDYYLHHLFLALIVLRDEQIQKMHLDPKGKRDLTRECFSNETTAQFVLSHSRRFLQKFSKIPFFEVAWINNPFHEDPYSLQTYDESLLQLLRAIQKSPANMRRTMVIILADHGDPKPPFWHLNDMESYVERGLPPLFIRIPDALKTSFPGMRGALAANSKTLTTPFDIHHTLLHLLSIATSTTAANLSRKYPPVFSPTRPDRSSLLVTVGGNRTCAQTHIAQSVCLCNFEYKKGKENQKNKHFPHNRAQLVDFIILQMNMKLHNSRFKKICRPIKLREVKDSKRIGETKKTLTFLVLFVANLFDAMFESIVKIWKGTSKMKLLAVSLINQRQNHSGCIGSSKNDDEDANEIRQLCLCKIMPKYKY